MSEPATPICGNEAGGAASRPRPSDTGIQTYECDRGVDVDYDDMRSASSAITWCPKMKRLRDLEVPTSGQSPVPVTALDEQSLD